MFKPKKIVTVTKVMVLCLSDGKKKHHDVVSFRMGNFNIRNAIFLLCVFLLTNKGLFFLSLLSKGLLNM